ncbi:MAG: CDP-alcohol phosphatidyltransferase family protein [bacterium]
MTESVLTRFSESSLAQNASLSGFQTTVDNLVSTFVEEATRPTTLASMVAGGLTYRLIRSGSMMALGGRMAAPLVQTFSVGSALVSEAAAFETTSRALRVGFEGADASLLQIGGRNGIARGTLNSIVTFGALRGAGWLAEGQNVLVQHLAQSSAMVGGHQLTARFGWTDRPEGTLAEQFLRAEVTNLQLGFGMDAVHGLTGGRLAALERSLDLSIRSQQGGLFENRGSLLHLGPEMAFAVAHGEGEASSAPETLAEIMRRPLQMAILKNEGGGHESEPARERLESGVETTSSSPTARDTVEQLGQLLQRLARSEPEGYAERLREVEGLLKSNPETVRQVLALLRAIQADPTLAEKMDGVLSELQNSERDPQTNAQKARERLEDLQHNPEGFMRLRHLEPNAITAMAYLCAFGTILYSLQGKAEVGAILLPIAALFDKIDGGWARKRNAQHPVGALADSFADLSAYGLATATFVHSVLSQHGETAMGYTAGALIALNAFMRLCVFDYLENHAEHAPRVDVIGNAVSKKRSDFVGMPSTMMGLIVPALYAAFGRNHPDAFYFGSAIAGSAMFWPLRFIKFGSLFRGDHRINGAPLENPWRLPITLAGLTAPALAGGLAAYLGHDSQYLAWGAVGSLATYVFSPFIEWGARRVQQRRARNLPAAPVAEGSDTNPNHVENVLPSLLQSPQVQVRIKQERQGAPERDERREGPREEEEEAEGAEVPPAVRSVQNPGGE